ncbi:DnaD domain protein [Rossellomorea aquimaris]|uniref:DnaD domain-containing protein n=1 Tax=Rossellomorea aquimaris TaxID=189382 RepID=UPI001CD39A8A|nr:DnaD domain protein [Rossellomorea aquimaris]MCA1058091.1 DnaD domain protein [Rossellomorea aquimaris]
MFPGQFVFGRKVASVEMGMKESTLWDYMKILKEDGVINIKSNNKFSVVTIVNWVTYQSEEINTDNKPDSKLTTDRQQMDTYKNVKNLSSSGCSQNDVIEFYHQNLQIGVTSSPYVYQQIEHWTNDLNSDLVLAAMKLAAKKEKKGFDYTEGILKKWVEARVQTIDDARKFEQSFKQNGRKGTKKRPSKEDFDLSE